MASDDYFRAINWYIPKYCHVSIKKACEGIDLNPTTLTKGWTVANKPKAAKTRKTSNIARNKTVYLSKHTALLQKFGISFELEDQNGNISQPSPLPAGLTTLIDQANQNQLTLLLKMPKQQWHANIFQPSTLLYTPNADVAVGAYTSEELRRLFLQHHVVLWRLKEENIVGESKEIITYPAPPANLRFGFFFPTQSLWQCCDRSKPYEKGVDRSFPFGLYEVAVRPGAPFSKADLQSKFGYHSTSSTTEYAILDVKGYLPQYKNLRLDSMFKVYRSDYLLRIRKLDKFLANKIHRQDLPVYPMPWVADDGDHPQ